MRQFMSYIGIPEDTIRKLAIEAMREEEGDVKYEKKKFVTFKNKTLPKNAHKLDVWLEKYVANDLTEPQWKKIDGVLKYLESRGIGADWYDFMYSSSKVWDVHQRLLIRTPSRRKRRCACRQNHQSNRRTRMAPFQKRRTKIQIGKIKRNGAF